MWYVVEWLVKLSQKRNAYYRISFEREAYRHEHNLNYLRHRKHYAWWKMMRK